MHVSFLTRSAVAASVIAGIAGLSAGPAGAAVPRPAATAYSIAGTLYGVAAVSASSAWAVGYTGSSAEKTLMLHWNGKAWSRVTSLKVLDGAEGSLSAVKVVSAKNAWAVGTTLGHTLI